MAARDHSKLSGDLVRWLTDAGWRQQRTWSTRERWSRDSCTVAPGVIADLLLTIHYAPPIRRTDYSALAELPGECRIGAATAEGRRLLAAHGYPLVLCSGIRNRPSTECLKRELHQRGWAPAWYRPAQDRQPPPASGSGSKLSVDLDTWLHQAGWRYRDATDTSVSWIRRNAIDPRDPRRQATLLLVVEYAPLRAGRILPHREPGAFAVFELRDDGTRQLFNNWPEGTDFQRTLWGHSWGPPRWEPGQRRPAEDRPTTARDTWRWTWDAAKEPDQDDHAETREATWEAMRGMHETLERLTSDMLRGTGAWDSAASPTESTWGTGINWGQVNGEAKARETQRRGEAEEEATFSPLVKRRIAEAEARGREKGEANGKQQAELLWSQRVERARSQGWSEGNAAGRHTGRLEAFIGHHCQAAGGSVGGLSFEVLRAMVELCHPDHQPEERRAKATRVTAALIPLMQAARPKR